MKLTEAKFEELVTNLAFRPAAKVQAVLLDAGIKVTLEKNKWYPKSLFDIEQIDEWQEVLLKNDEMSMEGGHKYTVGYRDSCSELKLQNNTVEWTHFMILE